VEEGWVIWEDERCEYNDDAGRCPGVRLGNDGNCLTHTTADQRDLALAMFSAGADLNFTRGVPFSSALLTKILDVAPAKEGHPELINADFTHATFNGDATFSGVIFNGDATFSGATFNGDATFSGATFNGDTTFSGATIDGDADWSDSTFRYGQFGRPTTFNGPASFSSATFKGDTTFLGAKFHDAKFGGARFKRLATFSGTTFGGNADFSGLSPATFFDEEAVFSFATFCADANLRGVTFNGDAEFQEATFKMNAIFSAATFCGVAAFAGARFGRFAEFDEVTFEKARRFGPVITDEMLSFEGATFSTDIEIKAAARLLICNSARFRDEANLLVRWADVSLEDADLAAACLVDRAPSAFEGVSSPPRKLDESNLVDGREPEAQPRIVSVRRANVVNLTLADVDLQACRFAGAHELDGLRIESKRQFAERPQGWKGQLGWQPLWKWTVRRVIAEEHEWRGKNECGIRQTGWYPGACQHPLPGSEEHWHLRLNDEVAPLPPADIQTIYRQLRKGREDGKDEPGAADFYYGEMEMRRAAAAPRGFEKLILGLYWLVSGYGLRASRALAALACTVFLCSAAINAWGLPTSDERGLAEVLVFGMQSTTSLLRAPDISLTLPGQVIQIALRLLGPLFFGLALLSLRGRVKR
jgi:hypothetical protein